MVYVIKTSAKTKYNMFMIAYALLSLQASKDVVLLMPGQLWQLSFFEACV